MTTIHPAEEAIRRTWESRTEPIRGSYARGSVTGRPRELLRLITDKLVAAGVDSTSIRVEQVLGLPGSYGVNDSWDLIISAKGIPAAAIVIKSQVGPSFGNNLRNRMSELLSRAADVDRQYSTDELKNYKPCLGVLFLLEESQGSTAPVRKRAGILNIEDGSTGASSYKEQYAEFFRRLLRDRMYDTICYLTATPLPELKVSEPDIEMAFENFISTIAERVAHLNSLEGDFGFDSVGFGKLLALRDDLGRVMSGLTSTPIGLMAAQLAVIERRRQIVSGLIKLSLDDKVNETRMQKAIGSHYWIFGGQYIGMAARRDLMPLDEHDIPLICADGSLEIFELKGPESRIVKQHRNHLIVSSEVHEAVSQCIGYLRTIDEMGAALRTLHQNELGLDYDYRRARGVVVIGHQDRAKAAGVTRASVDQAIRSYNAHLSRVRVVTYADLLESAERMLKFESEIGRDA